MPVPKIVALRIENSDIPLANSTLHQSLFESTHLEPSLDGTDNQPQVMPTTTTVVRTSMKTIDSDASQTYEEPAQGSNPPKTKRSQGIACLRCRARKTKCDGCEPCAFCVSRDETCVYQERRQAKGPRTILKTKFATLQRRYETLLRDIASQTIKSTALSIAGSTSLRRDKHNETIFSNDFRDKLLLTGSYFLVGCGIDVEGFLTDLVIPDGKNPHLALLNAFTLLTTWLTSADHPLRRVAPPPEYFLSQTQTHLVDSLEHVNGLMSYILASAFLALWYMQNGRMLEAHFQSSSTARLAIDCGLHQIDEDAVRQVVDPLYDDMVGILWGLLGPPATARELQQRIRVFWICLLMDKAASMITGLPTAFDGYTSDPKLTITTVFLEPTSDAEGTVDNLTSVDDLMQFTQLVPIIPTATQPILKPVRPTQNMAIATGQAWTLMSRADRLAKDRPRNLAEAEALRTGIIKLNTAFSCFAANIPALVTPSLHRTQPPPFAYGTPTAQQGYGAVVNTACAAYVVLIKMYRAIELLLERDFLQADGFDRETRKKRWMTARAIAVLARQLSMELQWPDGARRLTEVHNPVLADCWLTAAGVFVEQVAELMALSGPPSDEATDDIRVALEHFGMTVMALKCAAEVLPHVIGQVKKLEKEMRTAREGKA